MTTPSDTARKLSGGIAELEPAIAGALTAAYARGIADAARVAECDCCDVCGESPGYPKCANVIAEEIRALGERK